MNIYYLITASQGGGGQRGGDLAESLCAEIVVEVEPQPDAVPAGATEGAHLFDGRRGLKRP